MKNKNAVLLFGLPRGCKKTWGSLIENICIPNDADIFIHSWFLNGGSDNWHKSKEPDSSQLKKYLDFFLKSARTKLLAIDRQVVFEPRVIKLNGSDVYYSNQINMWKSVERVCDLLDHYSMYSGVKYSNLIVTRPDLLFKKELQIADNILDGMLYHGGVYRGGELNGEDLLMVLNRQSRAGITTILNNSMDMFYSKNNIYNPLNEQFELHSLNYTLNKDFFIHRHVGLIQKIKGMIRKCI